MFKDKDKKGFYEVDLPDPEKSKRYVFSELAQQTQNYPPQEPVKVADCSKKSAVKDTLQNFIQRIGYSFAIFAILFLIINWQSYSQILQAKIDKWRGTAKTSVLHELIDEELSLDMNENQKIFPITTLRTKTFDKSKIGATQTDSIQKITKTEDRKLLKINKNPEMEKKNIPALEMEIRPPDTRLVVPRLNRNVPIVQVRADNLLKRDWDSLESDMMEALKFGVVHFPGTAMPGEQGNIALTGHSSYFPWDSGRFKDVFALLHDVQMGDKLLLYHKQTKYIYEVYDIKIVKPDQMDVLEPTKENILTLITCSPVGTDLNRLVVRAKLIKEA